VAKKVKLSQNPVQNAAEESKKLVTLLDENDENNQKGLTED